MPLAGYVKGRLKDEGSVQLMDFLFKFTDSLIIISARRKGPRPAGAVEEQLLGNFLFSSGSEGRCRSTTQGAQMGGCLGADSALLWRVATGMVLGGQRGRGSWWVTYP